MGPNPFLGVFYHWLGGLAAASFYLPLRGVKQWSWETYWLIQGGFSWILAPSLVAVALVPGLVSVFSRATLECIGMTIFWGLLWGFGGLTFGLSVRYLGIALGYAIALGLCTAFGTLIPPLFSGELGKMADDAAGRIILLGIGVCLAGIAVSGLAGMSKERELSREQKQGTVEEFNFGKGLLVATFAGAMSACFAYGLAAGKPIAAIARDQLLQHGRLDLWQNLPVLILVMLGGFTTNAVWCGVLLIRNRSAAEFLHAGPRETEKTRLTANYLLCAAAGVTWYLQFFFYSMGTTKMGKYDFSSWTLHMASIIIFSTLWGVALKEWHGTSRRTKTLVVLGLATLIGSTVVVGFGNYLKARGAGGL